ncbi:MAG: hypothetical protein ACRDIB_06270, partial [Ardenticatenaceae bacterium]
DLLDILKSAQKQYKIENLQAAYTSFSGWLSLTPMGQVWGYETYRGGLLAQSLRMGEEQYSRGGGRKALRLASFHLPSSRRKEK